MTLRITLCTLLLTCGGFAAEWFPVQIEAPSYPLLAGQARIDGVVTLRLVLGGDGRVMRAEVMSGNPVLARAAQLNALAWRFAQPCADRSDESAIEFRYEFKLQGDTLQKPETRFRYEHPYRVIIVSQSQHWTPARGERR